MSENLTDQEVYKRIGEALRDRAFQIKAAEATDFAYRQNEIAKLAPGEQAPAYLKAPTFTDLQKELLLRGEAGLSREERGVYDQGKAMLAMNLAGVYAVQEGVGIISLTSGLNAQQSLESIAEGRLTNTALSVLDRLAHLSWVSGQPFRSGDRDLRPIVQSFDALPSSEQVKDRIQINAAARVLRDRVLRHG